MGNFCRGPEAKINEDKIVYLRFEKAMILTEHFTFTKQKEIKILGILMRNYEKRRNVGGKLRSNRKAAELLENESTNFEGEGFNYKCFIGF